MSRSRIIAGKAVIVVEVLDNIQQSIGKIRSSMLRVANAATTAGEQAFRTGFFGAITSGAIIKQFASFEDSMLYLQTKLGIFGKAVGKEKAIMDDLELTIRNLGRTTSFTSNQVAEGAATLAQGGLTYQEIKDTLQALLDLSRASRTEITSTAEALVRAMRAFAIPTAMAADVASMFTRATRAGTLELEDLTYALRYSQGTAASLQQTLPLMLALFAEMSNKGMAGSIAGTSMNTAMSQLVKKLEAIQEIYPDFQPLYGPNGFDFPQTLKLLFELMKDLDVLERKKMFQDIFNLRGERAATAAFDIDNVLKLEKAISGAGDEARKAAVTMDQGLGGAFRIALSAVQELALTVGNAAKGPLTNILRIVQELANRLSMLFQNNAGLATFILFSPGIMLGAAAGLIGLGKALTLLAGALTLVRGTMKQIVIPMAEGLLPLIRGAGTGGAAIGSGIKSGITSAYKAIAAYRSTPKTSKVSTQDIIDSAMRKSNMAFAKANDIGRLAVIDRNLALEKVRKTQAGLLVQEKQLTQQITRQRQVIGGLNKQLAEKAVLEARLTSLRLQRTGVLAEATMFPSAKALLKGVDKEILSTTSRLGNLTSQKLPTKLLNAQVLQKQLHSAQKQVREAAKRLPAKKGIADILYNSAIDKSQLQRIVGARYLGVANKLTSTLPQAKAGRGIFVSLKSLFSSKNVMSGLSKLPALFKGLGTGFMGFFRVMNSARRFIPSWWTIIDILILFGDKIPGISTILARFGEAFGKAFGEIGKIAGYARGPIELLRASMEAITAGEVSLGVNGIIKAVKDLAAITANQLMAGWERFKAVLGNIWSTIRGIGVSLWEVFNSLIFGIGSILESVFDRLGNVGRIFGIGRGGDSTNGGIDIFNKFGEYLNRTLNSIPYIFAIAAETLMGVLDTFLVNMEAALLRVVSFINPFGSASSEADKLAGERINIARKSAERIAAINKEWEASSKRISESFKLSAEQNNARADALNATSNKVMQSGFSTAGDIRNYLWSLSQQVAQAVASASTPDGPIGPKGGAMNQVMQIGNIIADSLVGSASDIRRNIIKYGSNVDEKQLEVLQEIRDNQVREMRQADGLLMGP